MGIEKSQLTLIGKEKCSPIDPKHLRFTRNGIDKQPTESKDKGIRYENYCFNQLLQMYPRDYIIGPRLVDYMATECKLSIFAQTGRKRPDSLILKPKTDGVYLDRIAEFKYGNSPDLEHQKIGFKDLINDFEKNPDAIHRGLQLALGESYHNVPLDCTRVINSKQVDVVFITTVEVYRHRSPYPEMIFKYKHRPIDLDQAA